MKLNYPPEFIDAVMQIYPDDISLHNLAIAGHDILGRWLDDNIPVVGAIRLLSFDTIEEAHKCAYEILKKSELYYWWNRIYQEAHNGT